MASPLVEVKDGAGAYAPAYPNGVDVAAGDTIVIHLIDSSAKSWSISCATTDELSSAATVNASLAIDPNARTATFTAPVLGRTYRFASIVDGGIAPDGTARPQQQTTFCVYVKTAAGRRVFAADETTEGDAAFGWAGRINDVIRNPSAGTTTPGGSDAYVQYNSGGSMAGAAGATYAGGFLTLASDLKLANSGHALRVASGTLAADATVTLPGATDTIVGRATTDTLTNKTLTSPAINGGTVTSAALVNPTISGTFIISSTTMQASGDARHKTYSTIGSAHTASATTTTVYSWTITDECVSFITIQGNAITDDGTASASWSRQLRVRSHSGTVTVGTVDPPFTEKESGISGDDLTIDNSGSTGRLRFTSTAAAQTLGFTITRAETTHP